jgi:signal transduction histidine kinase
MKSPRFLRTAAFRLALGFALALTGSTAAIFTYVYVETAQLEAARKSSYLELEVRETMDVPKAEMLDRVRTRMARDLRHNSVEALFDSQGASIAGNLATLPADMPIDGLAHRVMTLPLDSNEPDRKEVLLVAGRRPDGTVLALGHDLDDLIALQQVVREGLARGMIPAVLLSLLFGAFFAFRAVARIKTLERTIGRVMAGDLHERLPVRGSGDDLDSLTVRINAMLDEIVNLIEEIRAVGDNIAHDLRTPLSVMQARLERALAESDPEILHAIVGKSLADLGRTHATITSLLRIAEIESSRRLQCVGEADLGEIAREVHELYEPLAAEKHVDFTVSGAGAATVTGDRDMLIEALANLVDNAIKYTPKGGKVRIELEREPGGPLLRVTDTGFGIPATERSKVTQRYYRSDKSPNARGSGLGLSLVAAIAKLHGFSLRIADVEHGASVELACHA